MATIRGPYFWRLFPKAHDLLFVVHSLSGGNTRYKVSLRENFDDGPVRSALKKQIGGEVGNMGLKLEVEPAGATTQRVAQTWGGTNVYMVYLYTIHIHIWGEGRNVV